jgi:hypothetical protein
MSIINKKQLISYYLLGNEYDMPELLYTMDDDEFNEMILKDFRGFIYPLRKGYYIQK